MPKSFNLRGLNALKFGLFVTLSLLVVFLATCYFAKQNSSQEAFNRKQRFFKNAKFQLQQNGDYWVVHNFIKTSTSRSPNRTVTLTTHGTYQDFGNLEWLMVRWEAPISLTLYVSGDDYNKTLKSLCHLKYCTNVSTFFNQWVSVHLVIHNKHVPHKVEPFEKTKIFNFFVCYPGSPYEHGNQNETYWYKKGLQYPVNLLRNVARLNAKTYFVFNTDTLLLPTMNFPNHFISFANMYDAKKPLKSIYCIPIFPQFHDRPMPKYKSELFSQLYPYLEKQKSKKSLSMASDIEKWRKWLYLPIRDGLVDIYSTTDDQFYCSAYVSVNTLEPFYDQNIQESMYDKNSTRLLLLKALDFDFIILDGTFLIKRLRDTWIDIPEPKEGILKELQLENVEIMKKLYSLTLWFSG